MIAGTKYIIEDNRTRKRKELPELAFFKKKNYKILLADSNIKVNPDKLNVQNIPLSEIKVNTKLFQNRRHHYSVESVERILSAVENGDFNFELFDPILLYQDNDGQLWILSGHSRTEAFRRLCNAGNDDFCTIPAKIIKGISVEKAREIAMKSNTLQTKETDTERANYYRELLNSGAKKTKVKEECKKAEGRNCAFILRLAHLNPTGKLFKDYQSVEKSGASNAHLKTIADWIGEARSRYPQLTDIHENELYKWLEKVYGRGPGQIYNSLTFFERLNNILRKFDGKLPETLNLLHNDRTSSFIREYDEKLREAEQELNKAKKRLEQKRRELLQRGATKEQISKALLNYFQEVNFWAEELLKRKGDLEKYLQAEKRQQSLFGLGLGLTFDFFDINQIHDLNDLKKQYRKLALIYHPDKGGSVADMQKINEEYNYIFEEIVNGRNLTDDEKNVEVEVDEKYKDIIDKLTQYPGLNIEVVGSWIWISGATYPIRTQLKELGFRFAGKKKMWYWHSEAYKKKTRKHFTIEELRKIYGSQKVDVDKFSKKQLGAIEVLKQNNINIADFKGFEPTYNRNLDFSKYIKRCRPATTVRRQGDLRLTIDFIQKAIADHYCEVKNLADVLKANTIEQTVFNIWHFLRPINLGGQMNYHLDVAGTEQIRTPARSWDDRLHGVDCEDLAIFGASILKNLNIPYQLRIVGFLGASGYQHIFVVVPTSTGEIVLDPVMKMKFNELPKNIVRVMNINYISGIAGIDDPVMAEIDNLQKAMAGIGTIYTKEDFEVAKDIQKLARLLEARNMLFFRDLERKMNAESLSGLSGLWDKLNDKIKSLGEKIRSKGKDVVAKAKDIWTKAKNKAQKGWDLYKKYGWAPIRGAFLLLIKVNFFGLAKKLYVGYLSEAAAKRYNLNLSEWSKAVAGRKKFEDFWIKAGGRIEALKKAVTEGRAKKIFNKARPVNNIKGLGVVGADDAAAVATATATTAPFWSKVVSWFKNINWDKLFKVVDKVDNILPSGKETSDMDTTVTVTNSGTDMDGEDPNQNGMKVLIPIAALALSLLVF